MRIVLEHGYSAEIEIERDEGTGEPWKEHDGHGPVSEWTTRDKNPGERVLVTDRNHRRYYDWAEAIKIAKRDGWDAEPYGKGTKGEQAARAVERDYEYLRAWCNDEWHWIGYIVTVYDEGGNEVSKDSLWGIDDEDYAVREAKDEAKRIAVSHHDGRRLEWLQALRDARRAHEFAIFEARERLAWAERDVITEEEEHLTGS